MMPDPAAPSASERGKLLVALARDAIAQVLGERPPAPKLQRPGWLEAPGAVFVTLTRHGLLRGCIGSLEAHRPLWQDVEANARAAAFDDPRFAPMTSAEWPATRVEVSILSPARPMDFSDEADALAQLRPGIDGVILEHGWHRATFLPQVWEQLPDPREFMAHLKSKAGLAPNFWADGIRLSRYSVEKFKEAAS
jgi:AmmeMemoRadiSam system protein A